MKNKFLFLAFSLILIAFIFSCNKEFNETKDPNSSNTKRVTGEGIMNISYDIKTNIYYDVNRENLNNLDLASINPSEEKQHIDMTLFKDGSVEMTLMKLDFDKTINIPNHVRPSDLPEIAKTHIKGNNIIYYDKNGKELSASTIKSSDMSQTVKKIEELQNNYSQDEINEVIATLQGNRYVDNLEDYISHAKENNFVIMEQGDDFVTIRSTMENQPSGMNLQNVLLIDRKNNRLMGNRIYDNNKLIQSTYFRYSKGKQQHIIDVRNEMITSLPSGQEITMQSISKIDNFKFSINLK